MISLLEFHYSVVEVEVSPWTYLPVLLVHLALAAIATVFLLRERRTRAIPLRPALALAWLLPFAGVIWVLSRIWQPRPPPIA